MTKEVFDQIVYDYLLNKKKKNKYKTCIIRTNMPSVSKKGDGASIVSFFPKDKEFEEIVKDYFNSGRYFIEIKTNGGTDTYIVPIEYITYIHFIK